MFRNILRTWNMTTCRMLISRASSVAEALDGLCVRLRISQG